MDDKEILIRQTVLMEETVKRVITIEGKVDSISQTQLSKTETRLAVSEEKVSRLEKIIYGALAAIMIELISILFLWMQPKH